MVLYLGQIIEITGKNMDARGIEILLISVVKCRKIFGFKNLLKKYTLPNCSFHDEDIIDRIVSNSTHFENASS